MVTSNNLPDKKVVKMTDQNNSVVVPQRTLLGEVNEHITCPLCRGYYIDATTIVECLHSFCRSCIIKHLQVKSYCPVCEMMINSAKPNIKLDKALQDIVYKLVPGLFQKEMERRQHFYASRPGPAASATPEQRGEDTERIIFSPEDVISFSLEYVDATDTDSISSKSSDSNEPQPMSATSRRYLQCPAVVNISHLKKFLSMKFDIDSTQFAIDILYKRVPLSDYYTLMDIAYIYNWKRNEPMRFFYQIIDYIAIRNRLFDINRKGSHFRDRKSSPASTEDTNVSSPAPNMNDNGSEPSSGTDSPMPGDNGTKQANDSSIRSNKPGLQNKAAHSDNNMNKNSLSSKNEDVEKSQFLNSFELTAKSNNLAAKTSPVKINPNENVLASDSQSLTNFVQPKFPNTSSKAEETLKRKQSPPSIHNVKKLKVEIEKTMTHSANSTLETIPSITQLEKNTDITGKTKENEHSIKVPFVPPSSSMSSSGSKIEIKHQVTIVKPQMPAAKQHMSENPSAKRSASGFQNIFSSPKRKTFELSNIQPPLTTQKIVSPLKLQMPKSDTPLSTLKPIDVHKPINFQKPIDVHKSTVKKIPDLKLSIPSQQTTQNKGQPVNKVRMDLLANNSDPTIDRSKILSQVKSSLTQNTGPTSGDPLKSLFDSCKINIPSSLSITLTDQKQDLRSPSEMIIDTKQNIVNKHLSGVNTGLHKVPSPPVHNYIEILKLPDTDSKKPNKSDVNSDAKLMTSNKIETGSTQLKPPIKSSETSSKGPVPNLKPIADTKLAKQSATYSSSPITFQQTFEQQLQSLQTDKKSKLSKNKTQVPKLVPATSKTFSAVNKLNSSNKPQSGTLLTTENKPSTALDLSTPHNIQSQLSPHQTKAFETMQSIANLAKKQNLPSKGAPLSQTFSSMSRPLTTGSSSLKIPSTGTIPPIKLDKVIPSGSQSSNSLKQELSSKVSQVKSTTSPTVSLPSYQMTSLHSPNTTQPSPRSQTRSPSSSPKLVIAEEKHIVSNPSEQNINQSSLITSTQLSNMTIPVSESLKASPGPSRPINKPLKPMTTTGIITGIQQPITPTLKPSPTAADIQLLTAHQAILRQQMEMNAWFKAQRQFDIYKNLTNISHQSQNEFNNDK